MAFVHLTPIPAREFQLGLNTPSAFPGDHVEEIARIASERASGRDEAALAQAAASVTSLGGRGSGVRCDHRDDAQTEALFAAALRELGGLDLLVNHAWGGYEQMSEAGEFSWPRPHWEQPLWRWNALFAGRVRAAYACSRLAARSSPRSWRGITASRTWTARSRGR